MSRPRAKAGGYTWAALNTYGKVIDRYDGDAKRRANLVNLRLNRDIGERAVIGAMAVHKHQDDRDVGLLSVNGRLGLGRDWTATGQLVGNSTGGSPHHAYHASTNWRNQSGLNGFLSSWKRSARGSGPTRPVWKTRRTAGPGGP